MWPQKPLKAKWQLHKTQPPSQSNQSKLVPSQMSAGGKHSTVIATPLSNRIVFLTDEHSAASDFEIMIKMVTKNLFNRFTAWRKTNQVDGGSGQTNIIRPVKLSSTLRSTWNPSTQWFWNLKRLKGQKVGVKSRAEPWRCSTKKKTHGFDGDAPVDAVHENVELVETSVGRKVKYWSGQRALDWLGGTTDFLWYPSFFPLECCYFCPQCLATSSTSLAGVGVDGGRGL